LDPSQEAKVAGETRKEKEKRAQKDDERRAAKRKEADLPGMIMQVGTCEQPNRLPRCGPSSQGQRRAFMKSPARLRGHAIDRLWSALRQPGAPEGARSDAGEAGTVPDCLALPAHG
jgi:hypothetical protein